MLAKIEQKKYQTLKKLKNLNKTKISFTFKPKHFK